MLGGTPITLRGPCVLPEDIVECTFEGVNGTVEGIFLESNNQNIVVCVSPAFQSQGWKDLRVTIQQDDDVRYEQFTEFYAGKGTNT